MINIINNILISNGYKKIELVLQQDVADIYLFCPLTESKREEYFVTIQLHTQSDSTAEHLLENQVQDWFETISRSGKVDQTFEKNCTMLLCHEENEISIKTILKIEEDQYNFKKNVIACSQQEVLSLQNYLTQKQVKNVTTKVINDIINVDNGRGFLNFKKNNKLQKDYYSLILKIALKLPFITYTPQEQELSNLLNEIDNSLSPELASIYTQLTSSDVEWTETNSVQNIEIIWGKSV
ncbi:ABC-three component system middle component 1 [Pseudoalteromonas sp. ASV78]|uniref:ABC-three component system middle component 1 n=1 Tax=Pseudoalteromonas sp. ASV78 TaxID=3397851 RepID=UPI0039FD4587